MTNKISVIITAAGSSSRMKSNINKLFLKVDENDTVIEKTLKAFIGFDNIVEIILVTKKEFFDKFLKIKKSLPLNIKLVEGGNSREISTFNGLLAVCEQSQYVLCHDGARPLVSKDNILKVINELSNFDAVITAVKAKDTMKLVTEKNEVIKTLDRRFLYNVQTPQAFKKELILKAYKKYFENSFFVTDDSSVVEDFTKVIKVVEGDYSNIKVTTQEDIVYIREILKRGAI